MKTKPNIVGYASTPADFVDEQKTCKRCGKPFAPEKIKKEYTHLFILANRKGMEALTEAERALVNEEVCSKCYHKLKSLTKRIRSFCRDLLLLD